MKRFIFLGTFFMATLLHAQTVLKFETHGYGNHSSNPMIMTKHTETGEKGSNVVWDFTSVEMKKEFVGSFSDPKNNEGFQLFPEANICLEEFGNVFYFQADNQISRQVGYVSKEGSITKYSEPFVKMKYPFVFGDSFSGTYSADCFQDEKTIGPLSGTYTVAADAHGTLMLPNNLVYNNALRVVERQNNVQEINGKSYQVTHEAYRWYVQQHRFPIFVVVNSQWEYPDGKTHKATLAAYNPVVVYHGNDALAIDGQEQKSTLSIYPIPVKDNFSVRLFTKAASKTRVDILDAKGNTISTIDKLSNAEGEFLYSLSAKNLGLVSGIYFLKVTDGEKVVTERFVVE
jgi:hypothetical protein